MMVCPKSGLYAQHGSLSRRANVYAFSVVVLIVMALVYASASHAQSQAPDWQAQVRKYAEAKDWDSAMRVVEHEIARAPRDMDACGRGGHACWRGPENLRRRGRNTSKS